jgi:hypothetical protein
MIPMTRFRPSSIGEGQEFGAQSGAHKLPNERGRVRAAGFRYDSKYLKTSEGGENDSFAKPLYGLIPVSRVRIPLSPPVLTFSIAYVSFDCKRHHHRSRFRCPVGVLSLVQATTQRGEFGTVSDSPQPN